MGLYIWDCSAVHYVAYTGDVLLRPPHIVFYILICRLICKLRRAGSWKGYNEKMFLRFFFPAFGQATVTGVVPSHPRFLPSICNSHRVQQSHCSSIFHRVLLTHAPALSASQLVVHKKKSPRIYASMHSAGLELTKLTSIPGSRIT